MSPLFLFAVLLLVSAQLVLPRRLAFLPLVIAGCHLGNIEILPQLTTARILILVGLTRAAAGGHLNISLRHPLDICALVFAFVTLASSIGHEPDQTTASPFIARAGWVLNVLGSYVYGRAYLHGVVSLEKLTKLIPFILLPLAFALNLEQRAQKNLYFTLGATSDGAMVREDKVRAKGPFRHPILAGSIGAAMISFAFLHWRRRNRALSAATFAACVLIVFASASSGPLAAATCAAGCMSFWRFRQHTRKLVFGIIGLMLLYSLLSGRGPWYLMAKIDLVGGSTGWHRAYLIDSAFRRLGEWWLWGTDYTRHWMPTGVSWNPNHADITNYYLHFGVIGGLPMMFCLIGFIVISYRLLFRCMRQLRLRPDHDQTEYLLWAVSASLTAHAISFLSISYFDQMYIYFYVLVGAIPGVVCDIEKRMRESQMESYQIDDAEFVPARTYGPGPA